MESNMRFCILSSYALTLNPNTILEDIQAVMNTPSYDSTFAYTPIHKMGCSYHPQWRNQVGCNEYYTTRTPKCLLDGHQELVL